MANKKIRTDKFTSKAGDFTVVKPAPKQGTKPAAKTTKKK